MKLFYSFFGFVILLVALSCCKKEKSNACGSLTVNYNRTVYHTVKIGNQCWMKENLNIGMRINGSLNQLDNGTIEKYCYDDNESNCNTYGGLYQWGEATQYSNYEGTRGICPAGWHIPKDSEWSTLVNYLGGWTVAGGKLKESGTTHWNSPNAGADNSSGFTALPGGYVHNAGIYGSIGSYGLWWSSTKYNAATAWSRSMSSDEPDILYNYINFVFGHSIRCLADSSTVH